MRVYEIKILKEDANGYVPATRLRPLKVMVSDEEVNFGITLNEGGSNIIVFDRLLLAGEIIKIEFESSLPKVTSKNPYSKNALYPLYTSDVKFRLNHKYEFFLKADKEYSSTFQTNFDPYFSTVKRVRMDTGSLLDNVKDEVIANLIYDNSKLVVSKMVEDDESIYDHEDFEYGVPVYVKNYVRYKTDIDLCYAIYLSKTGKLGAFKKKLGDLDVSNEIKLPALDEMLSRFKELFRPNEELVEGDSTITVATYLKASTTEYTVSSRGVF